MVDKRKRSYSNWKSRPAHAGIMQCPTDKLDRKHFTKDSTECLKGREEAD